MVDCVGLSVGWINRGLSCVDAASPMAIAFVCADSRRVDQSGAELCVDAASLASEPRRIAWGTVVELGDATGVTQSGDIAEIVPRLSSASLSKAGPMAIAFVCVDSPHIEP